MRKVPGFKGVYDWMRPVRKRYFARVTRTDRLHFSRNFQTPEEAAAAFNEIAARHPPGRPGRKPALSMSSHHRATGD